MVFKGLTTATRKLCVNVRMLSSVYEPILSKLAMILNPTELYIFILVEVILTVFIVTDNSELYILKLS